MQLRYGQPIANVAAILLLLFGASNVAAQTQATSATPTVFHLLEATIDDVHAALRSGRTTCRELVELYLKRVAAYDKSGPGLNAVQAINPRALQEADRLDAAFKASGPVGALHCIPVLVKDQLETDRHADNLRIGCVQGFRSTERCHGCDQAKKRGRRHYRQGDDGRICVRDRGLRVGADSERV